MVILSWKNPQVMRSFADADLEFVVVGGYAIGGLGRHRFPVDFDMLMRRKI